MPKEFERTRRVAELLQRELALLIEHDVSDPRVGMVTVTAVKVSKDLAHATVYITALDSQPEHGPLVAALNHAGGFLRRRLSDRLTLRVVPQLRFRYDTSIERGIELSRLIERAVDRDDDDQGNSD